MFGQRINNSSKRFACIPQMFDREMKKKKTFTMLGSDLKYLFEKLNN